MQRHLEITDAEWGEYIRSIDKPGLNEWFALQVSRGLDYYRARLARIGFSGERVLDAGCGMGNWALGLAASFDNVVAIENDKERLDVLTGLAPRFGGRIETQVCSVEVLPFEDGSFDSVFCNGVVFVTDTPRTLAEFARVLKPGGKLYVTFVGKAWWRHLIHDRGSTEPVCVMYGANGYISKYFSLMDEVLANVAPELRAQEAVGAELLRAFPRDGLSWPYSRRLQEAYSGYLKAVEDEARYSFEDLVWCEGLRWLRGETMRGKIARVADAAAVYLEELGASPIAPTYKARVVRDLVSRFALGRGDYTIEVSTFTYEPEDMVSQLVANGFNNIEVAHEGCLCLDPKAPSAEPIYLRNLGVFECVALRSGGQRGVR